jgi:SAM-dependent methyltransferase
MQEPVLSAQAQRDIDSEEAVYANYRTNYRRWSHVLANPNAEYGRAVFYAMIKDAVLGKRVLEIGCNMGSLSARAAGYGAGYVLGTDISAEMIAIANQTHAVPGTCEFAVLDATLPFKDVFDVIFGHAVLHHFAFRDVLLRLHRENLAPGGRMMFFEPLASNLCMRLFRQFTRDAHTRDERALSPTDIFWMRQHFPHLTLVPINYVSIPLGALSSVVFSSPDNGLLQAADRIDRTLARHARFLHPRFRYAIFSLQ